MLHGTAKSCVFLRERAPPSPGWGEDHSKVSQTHKPHSSTFSMSHQTINSPLQARLCNTAASRPQSHRFCTIVQNPGRASPLSSVATNTATKKWTLHFDCVSSNPSNLEVIRVETQEKKARKLRTLPCKEASSWWNTKLYFPQSSRN